MCGICGIVNFNARRVDRDLVARMTSAQAHRGPDDHGYFVENNVGLGHRRLSIIDLSGGRQPIFNEDGSVVVIFNGEIYNYGDLTGDLIAKGHQFRTRSDTETIVHAYEEYGNTCMRDFRGMFAFAVWDRRRKRLLLVRDRLGIKPVYYYLGQDFFVFASEIKSLLQHPRVPREVDRDALDLYLALRYVPGPGTVFKNIYKLQPGHWMTVDESGRTEVRKYWDIEYGDTVGNAPEFSNTLSEFRQLLEESVRLRLVSEVPLGVFLSGGLDSSAVLAMMSKITGGERIKTFSVGYDASGPGKAEIESANEFSFARQAATHFRADHHEFRMTARDFRNAIPTMVAHLDEPMADPTCIPLYFISKLARNYITVVLSGEGADETMAGYTLYRKVLALDRMRRTAGPLAAAFPALARLPLDSRIRSYLRRAGMRIEDHYRGVVKGVPLETRLALTGVDRVQKADMTLDGIFDAHFSRVQKMSPLNRMLYADAKVWLPEDLLLKADKMTMATGVELRVPFLDHKLVEYLAGLRDDMKVRGGQGKWILRHVMRTELPPSILHRTKKGFPMPAETWFRFELRDFVRDTLLAHNSACRQFFHSQAVEDIVSLQEKGKFCGHQEVWSLLVFEFWHKQFIEDFGFAKTANVPTRQDVFARRGA
jgi:asparagine synthase (glutamine-hydrolysing)